ncbi:MAG: TatD family hydrolase, partial [Firmicutes bacterium]|nr:TatD family hydrolase [Bacillota bacterium]
MLFDSHAHLDDRAFDLDRSELIRTLPERGIGLLMDPGCSLASSYAAAALAEETPWIYAAAGS